MRLIAAFVFLVALFVLGYTTARESYYRGVYDSCVRAQAVDGSVTQFDLMVCENTEQAARDGNWYSVRMVRP